MDEVIDKDRLLERVWRGRIVEENAIQVHVSALRKSLVAGGDGQSYIVTVPGRGYRLVGIHASAPPKADLSSVRSKIPGTSVAVLRFVNLGGDPEQDYFADGIVEDIITGLSRIGGVFVIASKSSFVFDRDSPDFARIGRELSCRYLVRGSVRKADKRIRITARLLEAETGVSIWAEHYDRRLDDIFEVQDGQGQFAKAGSTVAGSSLLPTNCEVAAAPRLTKTLLPLSRGDEGRLTGSR